MDFIPGHDGEGLPRMLASFMAALLGDKPMRVVDRGDARRTIVSIHDALDAVMAILARRRVSEGQIFNIGNPANEVTVLELADHMRRGYARVAGDDRYCDHPIEFVTGTELYGEGYEDCDRRMPRMEKAAELLGWAPRIALPEVLLETMTYFHAEYATDLGERRVATVAP